MASIEVEELVNQHVWLAYFHAKRCLNKSPFLRDQSDEVYAAALRGLWHAARDFEPSRDLKFSTIARYKIWGEISNWKRKEHGKYKTKDRRKKIFKFATLKIDVAAGTNFVRDFHASDEAQAILSHLDDLQREVVVMAILEGRPYKEIALRYDVHENTIAKVFREARAKLRDCYEGVV